MQARKWMRKGLAMALIVMLLLSMLPVAAFAESYSATVTASDAVVYKSSKMSGTSVAIGEGTKVTVTATKNGIAKISRNGNTGYIWLDDLTAVEQTENSAAQTVTIKTDLIVYYKASTSAKTYNTPAGAEITIIDEGSNGWLKVKRKGATAYVQKDALQAAVKGTAQATATPEVTVEPTATPAPDATATPAPTNEPIDVIVTAKSAVYKNANASSAKLGTVYKGEALQCVDVSGKWALICKDGNYGYMLKANLTTEVEATVAPTVTPTPTVTVENDPIPCTVTGDQLVVYAKASTASSVLGKLKKGAQINVVDVSGNWAKVEKDGNYGYALKGKLTPTADLKTEATAAPETKFTATVISDTMVIYASASTKADKVATVKLGTTVNVHEGGSTWAYVSYDGNYGYAKISCMSARSHATYASGASGSDVTALNKQLLNLGYYDAVPGSSYNSATENAIKLLQAELGLDQTGKADITLVRVLKEGNPPASPLLSSVLEKGDAGSDVKRLQNRLFALGYLSKSASIDSDYGATTQNAVKLFQKAAGITQSGTANAATLKALYSTGAPTLPSGSKAADASIPSAADDPGSSDNSSLSASGQAKVETIIEYAKSKLGCKYVYGAEGPTVFDCSGFTQTAFKQVGVSLSRSAYSVGYGSAGTKIAYSGLVRGDIVCFNTISDSDLSDHVGIYLGSGKFIHASSGKGQVVISDMTSGYYNRVFSWGKRFIN